MQTTFQDVDLGIIRYSVVWEDYEMIRRCLNPSTKKRIGIISSAGCNVLNLALSGVEEIYAIDLNPTQNLLLELKCHLIQNYPYEVFSNLLSIHGKTALENTVAKLTPELPERFLALMPAIAHSGILSCGKLEKYIHAFLPTYPMFQDALRRLIQEDLRSKRLTLLEEFDHLGFKSAFCDYFEAVNLSKGRDPELFRYINQEAGLLFYARFTQYLERREGPLPFIFRFFFMGMENMPTALLPPAYKEENFIELRNNIHKIHFINDEAIGYLLSPDSPEFDGLVLSNIFEYCAKSEFEAAMQGLFKKGPDGLKLLYWNLLNLQYYPQYRQNQLSDACSQDESCFYFDTLNFYHYES